MYKLPQSNLQHVTAITFLLTTYAKYMKATKHIFYCGNSVIVNPDTLISLSKQQVDYILGENPIKMSYMVGFGSSFPMRIHHRASSLPSQVLLSNLSIAPRDSNFTTRKTQTLTLSREQS